MASCTLCASLLRVNRSDVRFTTREGAQSHANQHLLQTKHFDDENSSSLDQVFDQCFPNFVVTPASKQKIIKKEGRQSLLRVCRTLLSGRVSKTSPRVTCRNCGSGIVLYRVKEGGHLFDRAVEHASFHLGINLFECRKCGRAFSNKTTLRSHLWRTHRLRSLSEYFTDRSSDFIDEITNSIQQCFTDADNGKALDEIARMIRRRTLLNVCHTVFKGRMSKASPRVTCQKCGAGILLYDGNGGLQFGFAISHASSHLWIDLFECRKCGRSFGSKSAVNGHLISSHGLRSLSEYFTDKSGDFIEEITKSIEQCFTEGNNNGPSDGKVRKIRLYNEARVRSNTTGSNLAIERHLFCYRLIRQLAGDDGKVQCFLCPKRIVIKDVGGYKIQNAENHALVHLKKPMFRCNVCSNVRHTRGTIRLHLKSAHALPLMMNYECLAYEFHTDILDVLRKCYAEEQGK